MERNELLNKTVSERKEMLVNYLQMELDKVIDQTGVTLKEVECVQDLERMVEANIEWLNATKQTGANKLGFSMEEVEGIIKECNIPMDYLENTKDKIEAKKMDMIEKNLAIFEDISYYERWANDAKLCTTEDEFKEYIAYLESKQLLPDANVSKFEGIGYYDYHWDGYTVHIAGLDYVYTDEIIEDIQEMDEPILIIQERKLDNQIEAYMDYLKLNKYECTMTFKCKPNIDAIHRLDLFLKEMRKFAFVFHARIEPKYRHSDIEIKLTYFIEKEKQKDLEIDVIDRYKRGVEDWTNLGRIC